MYTIQKQLKRNAQSVGDITTFGYLGLVLSPNEYPLVTNVPFVRPPNPGPFQLPPFTSTSDAFAFKKAYNETKRAWKECMAVEKSLKNNTQILSRMLHALSYRPGFTVGL